MSSSVYTVDPWNLLAVALITVAGWAWIDHCRTRTSDFSRINYRWLPRMLAPRHAHEYASEGYNKINKKLGRPFRMTWWASENIFLPPEYLPDLKRASESSLSFLRNLSDAFSLGYSVGHLYDGPLMITIVRSKLNTQLPLITPILAEEADYAIDKEIGFCKTWTPRNAADVLTRIMHRMTSRILASPELCRDERYMSASISFMNSVTITGLLAIMFPLGPFRHLFVRILSLFHRRKLEAIIDIIEPVVRERLAAYSPDATTEPTHRDAIQWNIELAQGNPLELAPRRIALNTVQNLWAGSAGPAVTATQVIFQLLMMPAYFEPLVQEAQKAIEEHGWTDKALNQMHLLDSFIGEVNRMYPLGAVTAARTVMDEKFTFHDGLTLPKGSRIAFAIGAIQKDERFVENPETFNGYRFVAGAQAQEEGPESTADGAVNRAQSAATVTPTNLVFGYGKHACPGRFYAIRKIKIIFCKIAFRYDFKWTKVPKGRPQDFPVEGQFAPNQSQEISFRDRSEAAH
ncbi:cytochrome P450 monooxygenase [Xylaria sp. CBS 124048]|nr:cytochrome P450 monooxygenase [Xylaria sp. CBS 124048]